MSRRRFGAALGLSLLSSAWGCTATCLRDSDCIGASVCLQDRCTLLLPVETGSAPAPDSSTVSPASSSPPPAGGDVTSGDVASGEVGSITTATRGIFDAGLDAAPPAPEL